MKAEVRVTATGSSYTVRLTLDPDTKRTTLTVAKGDNEFTFIAADSPDEAVQRVEKMAEEITDLARRVAELAKRTLGGG